MNGLPEDITNDGFVLYLIYINVKRRISIYDT